MRANSDDLRRDPPPGAAGLPGLLAVHPGGSFGTGAAAALAGRSEDETGELLDALVRRGLLAVDEEGRHRRFRKPSDEPTGRAPSPDERDAALGRVLDWYLSGVAAADLTLGPGRWRLGPAYERVHPLDAKDDAWEWLESERANLRAAVEAAHAHARDEHAWWLCEALWHLYHLRGLYRDWIDTHELGVASAVRCGDPRAEARMRTQLGYALLGQARAGDAVREFTAARDAARSAADGRGEEEAAEALGRALLEQERRDEAFEVLETAVRLAEGTGDRRALLSARRHLGGAAGDAGDQARAMELLGPLPDDFLALDPPDRYGRARALTGLGRAYVRARRPDTAINFFGQALVIMQAERAVERQAGLWCRFADAARVRRDPDAERAALAEALPLYEAVESPRAAAVSARLEDLS
ncbi:hypothetical protein [Actinomadura rugatobispora]|uniref:Tetratricopeptide repeat protein n=1 Tax=Actinomadura rugatobispora TaxID=1994 RepID=A0ABW1ABE2_9ACTN